MEMQTIHNNKHENSYNNGGKWNGGKKLQHLIIGKNKLKKYWLISMFPISKTAKLKNHHNNVVGFPYNHYLLGWPTGGEQGGINCLGLHTSNISALKSHVFQGSTCLLRSISPWICTSLYLPHRWIESVRVEVVSRSSFQKELSCR